jgi:2,3-bisphosphoglycerate-dependent phosphoglycerate mutase
MDLYLIRHAQSLNNAQPVELRVHDPGLTAVGQEQAQRLAEHVAHLRLTRLITSPFRRALETAEPLRLSTGLPPEVRIDLHEKGGCVSGTVPPHFVGRPGMTRDEILCAYPHCRLEAGIDGEGWWRCQPLEVAEQARMRAVRLLQQTRAEFAAGHERVAFVTHGDFQLLFLSVFHELPLVLAFNASVTHIHITPKKTQLVDFNSVAHLPDHMLSW